MVLHEDKPEYEFFQDMANQIDLIRKDEHQSKVHLHHIRFFRLI
jgi:hypothetical protein